MREGYKFGDIDIIHDLAPGGSGAVSIKHTTYKALYSESPRFIQWNVVCPRVVDDVDTYIGVCCQINAPGKETLTAKLTNKTDGDSILRMSTDKKYHNIWTGWHEYTPSTTGTPVELLYHAKTKPGNKKAEFTHPVLYIGVKQ